MSDLSAALTAVPATGYVNLRGSADDAEFLNAAEKVLGQSLPVDANSTTTAAHSCYWLGPDEWLIRVKSDNAAGLLEDLERALVGKSIAINDLSGGLVGFRLSHPDARDWVARGCTLDLHESVFPVGACAQSGLGKASVLIALRDDAPTFDIVVRRSFAAYSNQWLAQITGENGIEFP